MITDINCKIRIYSDILSPVLDLQYWGAAVNLGESRKTNQPVSDFGGRHLPLSSISFASRENLLAICPPFYSPRLLFTWVPLMRFFFFSSFPGRGGLRGDGLLLAENTSPLRWPCIGRAMTTRWGHGSRHRSSMLWNGLSSLFLFLYDTLLHDIYSGFHIYFVVSWALISHCPSFLYANRRPLKVTRFTRRAMFQCKWPISLQDYSWSFKLT